MRIFYVLEISELHSITECYEICRAVLDVMNFKAQFN